MISHGEQLFTRFLWHFFACHKTLAHDLWRSLWPSETQVLAWQLQRTAETRGEQAVQHLQAVLTPGKMFELTLRVSPEGRPRRRDVRQLERAILDMVSREGEWC